MRFVDDIDQNVSADFMPRRYLNPLLRVLPFYAISLALVIGTLQFQDWFGSTHTSLIAFGLLTLVATFLYYQLVQSNDLVMANDFQNLLFASTASIGSSFCFFVRRNGTIVYANDSTRQMFPKFAYDEGNALDAVLDEGHIGAEDRTKLYSALTRGTKEHMIFDIREPGSSEAKPFILIIDPLKRPAGYFVVHGRPYRVNRKGQVTLTGTLANTSIEKIEYLLDSLPIGVYLTGNTGLIEYANPALEKIVRYDTRSLAGESVPIQRLIYHADGYETGEFALDEYTGDVLLSCRNQSLTQAFLEQRKLTQPDGSTSGALGIVTKAG